MGGLVFLALLASGLTFTTPDGWQPSPPGFIKLTGSERTIGRWDGAFNQFVSSFTFP